MREEYKTGLLRGTITGLLSAAVVFFTQWPLDTGTQALISATVLAGLAPFMALTGYGYNDAKRNNRP